VRISALIPNLNSGAMLDRCLEALAASGNVEEVLVMDAGSSDGSAARAGSREGVRVISRPGMGLPARQNLGMEEARNEHVLLLNSDAFVDPETPARLAAVLDQRPGVGATGAHLRFDDGSEQRSADRYKTLLRHTFSALPGSRLLPGRRPVSPKSAGTERVTWLPLCCVVIRRSAWRDVGGWDERFSFYYEDQDFCRRLVEAGWELVVRWDAGAIHVGGEAMGRGGSRSPSGWFERYHENRFRYLQKWYPRSWRIYAAVWMGRAWMHVLVWRARALRSRLRSDSDGARRAREWARAFQAAARP
jgi:GT2 family glycosyltransferase